MHPSGQAGEAVGVLSTAGGEGGGEAGGEGGGGAGGESGGGEKSMTRVQSGIVRVVMLELRPAMEMPAGSDETGSPPCAKPTSAASSAPILHTQHGSPSSRPLLWPSPSVSISHSSLLQTSPASRKDQRKAN
eukprot:scaffold9276_cov112-Isochrysis_galbana.AAC.3